MALALVGLVVGASTYSAAMNGLLVFLTAGSVLLGTRLALQHREP